FHSCCSCHPPHLPSSPTRRPSDLPTIAGQQGAPAHVWALDLPQVLDRAAGTERERPHVAPGQVVFHELVGRKHAGARHGHALGEDRKSTRLNSSHVKISYAVFCLK